MNNLFEALMMYVNIQLTKPFFIKQENSVSLAFMHIRSRLMVVYISYT
jgi:hypothetical protein